ncbi:MOSC domain-containing protein [Phycicoccus flavus]|uniref:MOSC domain-containing protein n=1 Tax=Phycicoccus flavus TaxID=2502783 RepID=A0A8T6R858_9MICO|nr:MOSC N-terminal beta barrel domain-containing protein [Phycicoccus flavus]NHA69874.1 MOSC domain-containing protein [Phycicoccus flavus]
MTVRLDGVLVHPVKSMRGRRVHAATVEPWGLRGDRRWMVVRPDGECLTAREDAGLLALTADTPDTDAGLDAALRLRADGHDDLHVEVPATAPEPVTVHGRPLTASAAGEEAHRWLRAALGRDDVRLVHVDEPRPLSPRHGRPGEATAFADGYPLTLATRASLRRLQDWVTATALESGAEPTALQMERFRPNLVLDGDLEPFEEDDWGHVTVGAVTLRVPKPVDRCVMTTIDPESRERGPEPIRTLARHRKWDGATWFAVQLVPESVGEVRVGDEVLPAPRAAGGGPAGDGA